MPTANCDVCKTSVSKYRCPTCLWRYCSSQCYRAHKADCKKSESPATAPRVELCPPEENGHHVVTEDTVPPEKLELLGHSENLKNLLKNPHLRRIVSALDASPDPRSLLDQAMREPIFVEFVNVCLQVVGD
ncbi:zinc finger HIT domain-containing protein 3 [Ixodes scapularis]|uniref:zinc finger HIT domain-containing protein 3 n=1 Tax=Ixodes scapularis TaxID=6945 RepID=UPI001A9D969D|nr:zinc finger HIT domain-containing protein 3 [Ixodes scapularis]